jgi:cell division protein FtsN
VSGSQRLSARDYKHGSRRGGAFDVTQYKPFGLGLGIGLAVALFVWLQAERAKPVAAVPEAKAVAAEVPPAEESEPTDHLEFYDMLPSFEVVIPEQERRSSREDAPAVAITKPGAYFLQAGSFRNRADAERQRDRLVKQGINATLQHVTIDDNEWHRVIVGPSRDLAYVNSMREALRAAQVPFGTYQLSE